MEYDYYKFSKGDKARLKETIKGRGFVGGFRDIFRDNPAAYQDIEVKKGACVTILQTPGDKSAISTSPDSYDIQITSGDTISHVPEYLLEADYF